MSYFVYLNEVPLYTVRSTYAGASFDLEADVVAGAHVDFIVGEGYNYGNTPLYATIQVLAVKDVNSLGLAPTNEYVVESGSLANESLTVTNLTDVAQRIEFDLLNPHPDLIATIASESIVLLAPRASADVALQFTSTNAANYDGLLLRAAVDGSSTIYTNLKVSVIPAGGVNLPNLVLASSDIQVLSSSTGTSVSLAALVHNTGRGEASDVVVRFFDFDKLIGEAVVPSLPARESQGAVVPLSVTGAGDHFITAVVDPRNTLVEVSEEDNEGSRMLHVGDSTPAEGGILLTGSLPSTVIAGSVFAVSGQVMYDILVGGIRYLDYVVKGGSVQMTVRDATGNSWTYGAVHSDINGGFVNYLQAPLTGGLYRVSVSATDKTFSAKREFVFRVVPPPPPSAPQPYTPAPPAWGGGSYDPVSGSWVWSSPPSSSVPASDLRIFSEGIYFSNERPAESEQITVAAEILYWASIVSQVATGVPVNFYATFPGAAKQLIERILVDRISLARPDFGSRLVFTSWRNSAPGIYLLEAEIDPNYADSYKLNNAATRAIIIGTLSNHTGVITGHVTDIAGGVPNTALEAVDSAGRSLGGAITDTSGTYLLTDIPPGSVQVEIVPPVGYETEASAKSVTVEDSAVSVVDFFVTPIPANRPPQCRCHDVVVATDSVSCTGAASIDFGSSDPDDNLVGCTQDPSGPLMVGDNQVTLTCHDAGQLSCSCTGRVSVRDHAPPVITCPLNMVLKATAGVSNAKFEAIGRDNCGAPSVTCQPGPASLVAGMNRVTCAAQDTSDNQASCAFDVYVNTAPTVACIALSVSADASCRGSASILSGSTDADADLLSCVQSPAADASLTLGTHSVTATCNDTHGGTGSCTTSVNVEDKSSPNIQCPANQAIECDRVSGAFAFLVGSDDNCGVTSTSCVYPSGSIFPRGTTSNHCFATDGSGNVGSCEFTVQVKDSKPPMIITRNEPVVLWPADHKLHDFTLADCIVQLADACEGSLKMDEAARITAISSDEEVDERTNRCNQGDGDVNQDIVISGPTTARLRAERNGSGDGRTYRVYFEAKDATGNTAAGSCDVVVPDSDQRHEQRHQRLKPKRCAYYVDCGRNSFERHWAEQIGCHNRR